jgi:hypothetical protein
MNTAVKASVFGLGLAVVLGGGWTIGRAVGPLPAAAASTEAAPPVAGDGSLPGAAPPAGAASLPGLAAVQNGYALDADTVQLPAGTSGAYRFRITDGSGAPVTRFAVEHDKRLHLVVVRRDGVHYRHVHPEMSADGTWSVPLTVPAAGAYRVFADFRPEGGPRTTLAADLQVPGDFRPAPATGERRTAAVAGYQVRLDGDLTAATSSTVHATITTHGRPVTDLQPYLGAYGHLVALRGSDLAYLHVHPDGSPGDGSTAAGPEVAFAVEVPTAGRYLLFLDFLHGGQVHTAEFVLDARSGSATGPATTPAAGGDEAGHGHGG